jgi:hypothetical protein
MRHSSANGGVFATCDVKVVMGLETLPFESLFWGSHLWMVRSSVASRSI